MDAAHPQRKGRAVSISKPDPRNNENDAYDAFMGMPESEWSGLLISLIRGGVLTPMEQRGFDRALLDRKKRPGMSSYTTEDLKTKLEGAKLALSCGLEGFREAHDEIVAELQRRGV